MLQPVFPKSIFLRTLVLVCLGIGTLKTQDSVVMYVKKMLHSKSSFWKFDSQSLLVH